MGETAWLNLSDKRWRSGSSIRFTFAPIPTSPRVPGCHGGEVALSKRGKIFSLRTWSVFSGTFPLKEIGTFSGRRRLRARNERQMAFVGEKKVPQQWGVKVNPHSPLQRPGDVKGDGRESQLEGRKVGWGCWVHMKPSSSCR